MKLQAPTTTRARVAALLALVCVALSSGCRCQCSNDHAAQEKPVFLPGTPGAPPPGK